MDEDHLTLNLDTVMDYVDDHTIGVVAILGITYMGRYDDVADLSMALAIKFVRDMKAEIAHLDEVESTSAEGAAKKPASKAHFDHSGR